MSISLEYTRNKCFVIELNIRDFQDKLLNTDFKNNLCSFDTLCLQEAGCVVQSSMIYHNLNQDYLIYFKQSHLYDVVEKWIEQCCLLKCVMRSLLE